MAFSDTLARVLTAAVLIPIVLALVLWAPQAVYAAAVAVFALLALREFLDLADRSAMAPLRYVSYLAVLALIAWLPAAGDVARLSLLPKAPRIGLIAWPPAAGDVALLAALLALALGMRSSRQLEKALPGAAATLLGIIYIGLPLALLAELRRLPDGPQWVIYVLVITWVGDTAAYFAGRSFGRRRMSPRISPGKTWEGAAASLAAAVLFSLAYLTYFVPQFPKAWSAAAALAVNAAGQVGDLAESALKRGAGVKDSSTLLPGHGGLLDRMDALLFAVPALWYIFSLRARFSAPL